MAKKIKHGAQRPPLSTMDKVFYGVEIFLSLFLALFALIYLGGKFLDKLHTAKGNVLWVNNELGLLCIFPFSAGFCFPLFILLCSARKKRIPIFGNADYKPKLFAPTVKVYPLGHPQYMENFTKRERLILRIMSIYLPVMLLISLVIYPMGIYPRRVYLENDTLITYNMFNEEIHKGQLLDAESLDITHNRSSGRHDGLPSNIVLHIHFSNESYTFTLPHTVAAVEKALYIKSQFSPDRITIDASEWVLINPEWDAEARPLLYELYESTP